MQVQSAVKKATLQIAAGEVIGSIIMIAVFVFLGKYDYTVLLGALLGSVAAVLNFFLMGLSVQRAAESMTPVPQAEGAADASSEEDVDGAPKQPLTEEGKLAKKRMQRNYTLRMLMLVVMAVLALALPCFHALAAVIPLLFPRVVILFQGFLQKEPEA